MARFWSCLGLRIVSLESKLQAWAKGAGKEKVVSAAAKNMNWNSICASLVSCITAAVPPVLAGGFSASASVDRSDTGATISLEFGNKTRPSFTGSVYDIYGLFSQGWSYDPRKAPYGIWHGKPTRAWPSRAGQKFVQSGVDAWKASLPSGINVESESINALYT